MVRVPLARPDSTSRARSPIMIVRRGSRQRSRKMNSTSSRFLVEVAVELGAIDVEEEPIQAEMPDDPVRVDRRLGSHHVEPAAAVLQLLQKLRDAGVHLIFEKANGLVSLAIVADSGLDQIVVVGAEQAGKGPAQRRADIVLQFRFARIGPAEALERVLDGLGDPLAGIAERAVQVEEQGQGFLHRVNHARTTGIETIITPPPEPSNVQGESRSLSALRAESQGLSAETKASDVTGFYGSS